VQKRITIDIEWSHSDIEVVEDVLNILNTMLPYIGDNVVIKCEDIPRIHYCQFEDSSEDKYGNELYYSCSEIIPVGHEFCETHTELEEAEF
jgi:hypothetical protein